MMNESYEYETLAFSARTNIIQPMLAFYAGRI
jgi:hypothetical protein